MHSNSLWMFQRHALGLIPAGARVLEIGPTGRPSAFRSSVSVEVGGWTTLGLDEGPHVDIVTSDPYRYPMSDGSCDVIVAGNVLEHVPRPWLWLKELHRISAPNGRLILVVPVSWPFHEYPVDCWRIYPDGMRALLSDHGWNPLVCVSGSIEAERFPRHVPGRSPGWWMHRPWNRLYRAAGRLGMVRVECAYDTVAVAERSKA